MRYFLLLFVLFFLGCLTEQRAQKQIIKIQEKHPRLFQSDTSYIYKIDTFEIEIPSYILDTILPIRDTVIVENERIKTIIKIVNRDSIPHYFINSEIKGTKVPVIVRDTVPVIKTEIITKTEYEKYVPWYVWMAFVFIIFAVAKLKE